jgi:hypothetical protein
MKTAFKAGAGRFPAAARYLLCLSLLGAGESAARKLNVRTVEELALGVRNALPRDTLLLSEGTYALKGYIQIDGKQDLTLASLSGDASKTVIRGKGFASMDGADDLLRIGSSKRISILNLGFQECHSYGIKLEAEKNPEDIVIRGCRFSQIGTRHIKGSTRPGTVALRGEITRCHFQNTSVPGADWQFEGDYIAAIDLMALDGWRISDNTFKDVKGRNGSGRAAIFIWVGSRNVTVERNNIVGCDRGIAFGNPSPSTNGAETHVSNSVARNNFIVVGPDAGIELAWVKDVQILHNSVWRSDVGGRGIRSIEKIDGARIANNLVRGRLLMTGAETLEGNVSGALDGAFRNPATGDLHLLPGASMAIDKGVAVEGAAEDYDGDRRPSGKAPDVGADEYGAPTAVLPSLRDGAREQGIPPGTAGRDVLGRNRKARIFFPDFQ